jgi:hypothetical protein
MYVVAKYLLTSGLQGLFVSVLNPPRFARGLLEGPPGFALSTSVNCSFECEECGALVV